MFRLGMLVAVVALASAISCGRGGGGGLSNVATADRDAGLDQGGDAGVAREAGPSAPDGGDFAGDAGMIPGCTLPALRGNLTRDWDVHLATVSGTLTLGGAVPPDSPGAVTRGNLVFRERTTYDVRTFPVASTGPASFSGSVFTGSYDVSFESVAASSLVGIPLGAKTHLADAVVVSGDVTVGYDLQLTTVSGTVTAAGAALPDSPQLSSRGNLVFREQRSGDVRSLPVGATGPGAFSGTFFAGTYDVSFETVSGTALVGLPTSAESRVATALALSGNRALTYDVAPTSVSGEITANGAALPDSPQLASRGNVIFRERQSGDVRTFAVPATGRGTYGGLLFGGNYDVSFQTPAGTATTLVGLPATSTTRIASAVAVGLGGGLGGAVVLGFDLPIASVDGTITAGGMPLPDSPALTTRGGLRFVERTTGLVTSLAVSGTGAGHFGGVLFGGVYDVTFTGNAAPGLVGLPPGGSKRVDSGVEIRDDVTLTYDLSLVAVSGTVTSGAAALPDSPTLGTRGNVVFRERETGTAINLPLAATGAATFSGRLFSSSYDVALTTANSPGLVGLPAATETRLTSNLTVDGDQAALIYDAPVITVSARVTVDGAALPDSPTLATRGNIVLRDKLTGAIRALPLPATGPGTITGLAFAGSYDVSLETSAADGLVGLPVGAETSLELGCLPAAACSHDPADLSGIWTFVFRDQASWIRWSVDLTQTDAVLGGQFVAASGYAGQFDSSSRTGDAITLSSMQNTATCVLRVDATLYGGCFMSGIGSCTSGVSQSPFVGLR